MPKDKKYNPGPEFFVNLKDGPRKFPATYHFPGGGPEEEACGSCDSFLPGNRKKGRCTRWIEKRGLGWKLDARENGDEKWWCGLPCIKADTQACKYWTPREEDDAADVHPTPSPQGNEEGGGRSPAEGVAATP